MQSPLWWGCQHTHTPDKWGLHKTSKPGTWADCQISLKGPISHPSAEASSNHTRFHVRPIQILAEGADNTLLTKQVCTLQTHKVPEGSRQRRLLLAVGTDHMVLNGKAGMNWTHKTPAGSRLTHYRGLLHKGVAQARHNGTTEHRQANTLITQIRGRVGVKVNWLKCSISSVLCPLIEQAWAMCSPACSTQPTGADG